MLLWQQQAIKEDEAGRELPQPMLGERMPVALATPPPWGQPQLEDGQASGWGRTRPLHPRVLPVPGHGVYASLEAPNEPQTGLGPGLMASGALISKASQQPPVLPTSQNNRCRLGIGQHLPAWWWLVKTCLLTWPLSAVHEQGFELSKYICQGGMCLEEVWGKREGTYISCFTASWGL